MKVVHFTRKRSNPGSIEILFYTIRKFLPKSLEVQAFFPRFKSQGFIKRLYIIVESYFNQGDVNHITGDIHFSSFLLNKRKTILTIHDCGSVIHSKGLKRVLLKYFWFTLPLKRVKYLTVISEKTKTELLSLVNFPQDRIFIVPDCISENFTFKEKDSFDIFKPRILQVGTKSNKNLIRICESLNGIPCCLDIVGDLSIVQVEALKNNQIEFENSSNISEKTLIDKYINADIVAFISTYEGFGMPILEAQTIGRAVLTSNISPMIEVAGEGACLVNPHDVNDMRNGFIKIISDAQFRKSTIESGLNNSSMYSPSVVAGKYFEIYQKVHEEFMGKNK